ncbi:pancreatic triacylglycerol lipase-like [Schistocerca cancellata]|uniref:pancreatic triacylglycerol lipase-like n=1 Tax=Schistocerca cancellata TaxID=274614 RepID=UPI0021180298|nr:pancreatic triacylglycerol lipase-like [Schistocerca cancellata]
MYLRQEEQMKCQAVIMGHKLLLLFLLIGLTCAHEERWELIPGGDGKLHLVDLNRDTELLAVSDSDVSFRLYTQSNPTSPQYVTIGDASSLGSFSASRPTRFAIHGWLASEDNLVAIRNGWIQAGDYNVIMVDWRGPASNILYAPARNAVPEVGQIVARFIDFLVQQGANAGNMEVAGHSLGAHVAGIAGNRAAATIGRIIAMDPAAPLFGGTAAADRVDSSDAAFVEVIHTSTLGWADPLGHADFFPNGGTFQEGCSAVDLECSHNRSYELYAESITSSAFVSYQCDSWNNFQNGNCNGNAQVAMGAPTPSGTTGTFYLRTNGSPPYAQG